MFDLPISSNFNHNEEQFSQILTRIFFFLPLSDHKNIRLVCSTWYKATAHHSITRNEKLVCVREYSQKRTFNVLSKCGYSYLNLEFRGFAIDRTSSQFWKKMGPKIHEIVFVDCMFSTNAARQIIIHCSQLRELSLERCSGFFSCDVFDYCMKIGTTRSCLETIKIKNDANISDYIFKKIFAIYPLVKNIAVCLLNDRFYNSVYKDVYFEQGTKTENPVYESKKIFSHSAVYEKLKASSNLIQDLEYIEVDKDICHMYNNFFHAIYLNQDLKLKKIYFSPSSFNSPSQMALNSFFMRQYKLEHIVLKNTHFNSQYCRLILNNCTNLQYFELIHLSNQDANGYTLEPIILHQDVLEKLLKSKLRSLKLHFDFRFEERECIYNVENNTTLRNLIINSNSLLQRDILILVEAFQGLTCLDLSNCKLDDELMQVILKNQVNLVSLILRFNNGITDFGLTGKPLKLEHFMTSKDTFSISRLKKLEILDLKDCKHITAATLEELMLPNLKFLCLQNCNTISYEGFSILGYNCPRLQFLDVGHTNITPESLIKLCLQLEKIHFLDITFCNIDELSIKITLNCNKSLRFLKHTSNVYYFNILKEQWKTTNTNVWLEVEDGNRIRKCFSFSDEESTSKFYCWSSFL